MSVEKSPKAKNSSDNSRTYRDRFIGVCHRRHRPPRRPLFWRPSAITLLVIGLERIGIGIIAKTMATRTRWATIGLGVLAVILAIVAIMYPTSTIVVILLILAVALLIIGISRALAGVTYKGTSRFSKSCMIGVGVLSIIVVDHDYGLTIIWFFPGISNPWSNFAAKWY